MRESATAPPRSLEQLERRLQAAASASDLLQPGALGEVRYAGFVAPVWWVRAQPTAEPRFRILVVGGLHGNEPAGVESALRLLERMARRRNGTGPDLYDVVPCANPWGWVHDQRHNHDDHDINRDFVHFETQEAQLLRDFVAQRRYDLVLDLHEDPSGSGFYLYQYDSPDRVASTAALDAVHDHGFAIEPDRWKQVLKSHGGLIDAPGWGLHVVELAGRLSMSNYLRLHNSERVYTLETPLGARWEVRLAMHRIALRTLLRSLARWATDSRMGGGAGATPRSCSHPPRRTSFRRWPRHRS